MLLHCLRKNRQIGSDRTNNIPKVKKPNLNELFRTEKNKNMDQKVLYLPTY